MHTNQVVCHTYDIPYCWARLPSVLATTFQDYKDTDFLQLLHKKFHTNKNILKTGRGIRFHQKA